MKALSVLEHDMLVGVIMDYLIVHDSSMDKNETFDIIAESVDLMMENILSNG